MNTTTPIPNNVPLKESLLAPLIHMDEGHLDPKPGRLNLKEFLVPVGQEVAATTARQTIIPVRMPPKSEFFRAHPEIVLAAYLLEPEEERGAKELPYLVHPGLAQELNESCIRLRHLYLAITLRKNLFLIPVSPQSADKWTASKMVLIPEARRTWLRAAADKSLGAYTLTYPTVSIPDPDWSVLKGDNEEILELAFRTRIIENANHPRLKELRGEF